MSWHRAWAAALLAGVCIPALAAPEQGPSRVLMLVSYHAGMAWSDAQVAGVTARLQAAGLPVDLHRDYLDAKQVALRPDYLHSFEAMLREKYRGRPPRLLLALDDDALDLALRLRARDLAGVPLLFSGVSASRRDALARLGRVAGVFDDVDFARNLHLMLQLLPATRRVVVVHDQSRTSQAQLQQLAAMTGLPDGLVFEHLSKLSAAEIQTRLRALGQGDLVLALPFNMDREQRLLTHEQAAALWAQAAQAPVVVSRDVSMQPGVLGGLLMTGQEQGELLGQMAVQVLQGRSVEQLPMQLAAGVPTFDAVQLARWGIRAGALPPGAVVLNQPPDPWAGLRGYLVWMVAAFGGLLLVIGVLVYDRRVRQRSARALKLSTANYTALFNSSNDGILVRDGHTLQILEVNPSFCRMFGYTAAEVVRLEAAQLCAGIPPYTGAELGRYLQQAIHEGPQTFGWQSRRKDGSLFWTEVSITCYRQGAQLRVVSTVRNITARKQLEVQTQAFQYLITQIFQNLPVAVFAVDSEQRVTFWNEQIRRLTGQSAEQMVGSTEAWRGIYAHARPVLVNAVVDGLRAEDLSQLYGDQVRNSEIVPEALEGEGRFPAIEGQPERWLRFCAAPLRDAQGQLLGGIETIIDLTDLKRAQLELLSLNEQLEQRVEVRTRELQQAMGQLMESEKLAALGSLVAGVAHELNTPIGNALSTASTMTAVARELGEVLESGAARRSEVLTRVGHLAQAAELVERNAERAAKLISEFKLVAVDQTSMRRREFDLLELVQDTLAMLAPMLRATPHRAVVRIRPGIRMDSYPGALEQIITNLVGNAVQHAFVSGRAGQLSFEAAVEGGELLLEVRDDGCGIDPETVPHVFEPFFTTALGRGGSGLGLYVVYNLVVGALGGSIRLYSQLQQGSCFTLLLPLRAPLAPV